MRLNTIYTIKNENGQDSSISLFKLDADVLQCICSDVHRKVQDTFNLVATKHPKLSRRSKGNIVRILLNREAMRSPIYQKLLNIFL